MYERRPEVARSLDGEDQMIDKLAACQFRDGCGKTPPELTPELFAETIRCHSEGKRRAQGQTVRIENLRFVLGFGWIDADDVPTGYYGTLPLELLKIMQLHQGPRGCEWKE
jgi:hypothetical protein